MKTALRLLAALALCAAGDALAVGGLVDVTVYDRTEGRTLQVFRHQGRHYVAGRPGNEYQVTIRNRTGEEVLAVLSVDGVNAITAETAGTGQSGYVIGPWGSVEVKGWRKSLERTAAFYFTELSDSYAARSGRPEDVGVVGVAVFRRKWSPPPAEVLQDLSKDAPASGAAEFPARPQAQAPRAKAEEKLGTGHGRNEHSPARYVEFERESATPNEVVALYYDSRPNLAARGVIREPRPLREPRPFPAGFVPDPPR
ncbi:MAG TPA: hypothetical protein VLC55_13450 [Burkholderiales bacterium]|nr:hypothetical protein [Burkholderiales bacterium]